MNTLVMLKRSFSQFRTNPLRTFLTLLGVVFGVGSVVAMMSIGEGAQREILAQIEAMGATSVHIEAKPAAKGELGTLVSSSTGLHRQDVLAIERVMPQVKQVAYRAKHDLSVTDLPYNAAEIDVFGINPALFDLHGLTLAQGRRLSPLDMRDHQRVAVVGPEIAKVFPDGALGKTIRLDYVYVHIVGVLGYKQKAKSSKSEQKGGAMALASAYDRAILLPFPTVGVELSPPKVYHELDMISVQVHTTAQTLEAKAGLARLLSDMHGGVRDVKITAPEEILRQKQATQAVFNAVLIAIAAISLLVGGIGVMNIMLANIMERIGEIGLRRAIGATRRDIRNQFLLESMITCIVGGVLGVLLGLVVSAVVGVVAKLPVGFAWESIVLSFGISLIVGVIFGLMPALRAANVDPIEALRDGS